MAYGVIEASFLDICSGQAALITGTSWQDICLSRHVRALDFSGILQGPSLPDIDLAGGRREGLRLQYLD